jgi:polyisoprenoid-binding protein YceI
MTSRTIIAAIAFLTACLSRTAFSADNYKIDPRHTSVIFSVGHAGLSYTYGMFRESAGRYTIDKEKPENSRFSFEIKADSLYTNDQERDTHLRSPSFFNVVQFPTIKFETTACTVTNDPKLGVIFNLTGNLTMHGVTRTIKVPMRMLAEGPGARKDHRTGFLCQLELNRSDYDMKALLEDNIVGDAVSVTISFEGSIEGAQTTSR